MKASADRSLSGLLTAGAILAAGAILWAQGVSWLQTLSIGDGPADGRRLGLVALSSPAILIGSAGSIAYIYALWCSRGVLKEVGRDRGFSIGALEGMTKAGWALAVGGGIQSVFSIAMSLLTASSPNLAALGILAMGFIVAIFAKALIRQAERRSYIDEF